MQLDLFSCTSRVKSVSLTAVTAGVLAVKLGGMTSAVVTCESQQGGVHCWDVWTELCVTSSIDCGNAHTHWCSDMPEDYQNGLAMCQVDLHCPDSVHCMQQMQLCMLIMSSLDIALGT